MKNIVTIIILLTLVLAACSESDDRAQESGVRVEEIALTLYIFEDSKELQKYLRDQGYDGVTKERGFAVWHTIGNECRLYVPKVKNGTINTDDLYVTHGHELRHCYDHSFHN